MSERKLLTGEAPRERPLFEEQGLGPWRGRVVVTPIRLARKTVFEVLAGWHGPPLEPLPDPGYAVDAEDAASFDDPELARRVAMQAADELRAGRRPVLRAVT